MAKKFIIGIDLGGTNLKIALLDLKYRIKYKEFLTTKKFLTRDSLISAITSSINKIIQDRNLKRINILGIGLGLPGLVDCRRGFVHYFPNIPGWKEVNLKKIMERKLKIPVFLDNDANLMCLAEARLGAARGFRNAVCLTLGTGVGGGILLEGAIYRGSAFAAGEVGHIPINERGPRCNCGGFACLEAYIGNRRILNQAKKIFGRKITLEELSLLAKRKNKRALFIWNEVANRLGVALCGVTNFLNPEAIILGGGVAAAGRVLFDRVRQSISRRAMPVQARRVKVLKAELGNAAGLIGAAVLVREGTG